MEKSAVIKIILGLIVVGAVVTAIFYWQKSKKLDESYLPDINIPGNPIENKLPETNPIEKTNPFKSIYKNPFSQ